MSDQIADTFYRKLGQTALKLAPNRTGRVLVYAAVEDQVISADVFYQNGPERVCMRVCPSKMRDLIYSFWERWKNTAGQKEWRVMCYLIDGAEFAVDFTYPDQLNWEERWPEVRSDMLKRYFGDAKIDYSNAKPFS